MEQKQSSRMSMDVGGGDSEDPLIALQNVWANHEMHCKSLTNRRCATPPTSIVSQNTKTFLSSCVAHDGKDEGADSWKYSGTTLGIIYNLILDTINDTIFYRTNCLTTNG